MVKNVTIIVVSFSLKIRLFAVLIYPEDLSKFFFVEFLIQTRHGQGHNHMIISRCKISCIDYYVMDVIVEPHRMRLWRMGDFSIDFSKQLSFFNFSLV